ncbi:MAG: hypothetical protein IKI17_03095 [Oscillospiraceae bacterium]|nr:hypothetical protein [Oscillospiraceae bacterium]
MPGNLLQAELGYPELSRYGSTDEKLTAIQNYLFLLLENLRYTLRNLSMEDNFNQSDLGRWVDGLDIAANVVVSNTVITNELYAAFGAIADLAVDELRTDWQRAQRYLDGDASNLDYIHIHDEAICFRTAVVQVSPGGTPLTEQLHHGTRYFWWRDAGRTEMTSLEDTGLPVTVYRYTEYDKGQFCFAEERDAGGTVQKIPVLKLGAGTDATGVNGTARLVKHADGLELSYTASGGELAALHMREDGFADLRQRRASVRVDTALQRIAVTPEGALGSPVLIQYTESAGGNLSLTWPDGASFTVEVV